MGEKKKVRPLKKRNYRGMAGGEESRMDHRGEVSTRPLYFSGKLEVICTTPTVERLRTSPVCSTITFGAGRHCCE